jgi:hypothetical protein
MGMAGIRRFGDFFGKSPNPLIPADGKRMAGWLEDWKVGGTAGWKIGRLGEGRLWKRIVNL